MKVCVLLFHFLKGLLLSWTGVVLDFHFFKLSNNVWYQIKGHILKSHKIDGTYTVCNWSLAPVTYFIVVQLSETLTVWKLVLPWRPLVGSLLILSESGMASGDSESLSMLCQKAYPRADGTRLALEHSSPLRQKEMVGVPLEMCLMPVKVSAGTLARSFLRALQWKQNITHSYTRSEKRQIVNLNVCVCARM